MTPRCRRPFSRLLAGLCIGASLAWTGCTAHLFSGVPQPDHSRPVAMIETRGGTELGACTDFGVLFLGRTAQDGPCRVHYLLGPTPMIEDGFVVPGGAWFYLADMDLKHQRASLLARDLAPGEPVTAMVWRNGSVQLAELQQAGAVADVDGDLLEHPGVRLPPGTPLFVPDPDFEDPRWKLVGLVAGELTIEGGGDTSGRFLVYAGPHRLREFLAVPSPHPRSPEVRHRPDDISVIR